jgi:hypothetical protein
LVLWKLDIDGDIVEAGNFQRAGFVVEDEFGHFRPIALLIWNNNGKKG